MAAITEFFRSIGLFLATGRVRMRPLVSLPLPDPDLVAERRMERRVVTRERWTGSVARTG